MNVMTEALADLHGQRVFTHAMLTAGGNRDDVATMLRQFIGELERNPSPIYDHLVREMEFSPSYEHMRFQISKHQTNYVPAPSAWSQRVREAEVFYNGLRVKELRVECKEQGIPGYHKMNRKGMIHALMCRVKIEAQKENEQ